MRTVTETELIAVQAQKIEEQKRQLKANKKAFKDIRSIIYCIGGPLNDNVLGYTPAQMVNFKRIADLCK